MTARKIGGLWVRGMVMGILVSLFTPLLYGDSFSSFVGPFTVIAILVAIGSVALGLVFRYRPTRDRVLAGIKERQRARHGQPRDLTALAAADADTRRTWYRVARRRVRRDVAARLLVMLPLIVISTAELWHQTLEVSHPVGFAVAGAFVAFYVVCTAWAVRGQLGDPVLLVGEFEFSQRTFGDEAAKAVLIFGRTRKVVVNVRTASILSVDGALRPSPNLVGRQAVPARRTVVRRLIEGEHCVLLCSGLPDALFQAGALPSRAA